MYPEWPLIMTLLVVAMILVPWVIVALRYRGRPSIAEWLPSTLAYVVAFNLVFIMQELALVLSKAVVPGLHPILYHNNHDWTGDAPIAELLQSTGALAIIAVGLIALAVAPRNAALRLFAAWVAFNGVVQGFAEFPTGAMLPGNDVGRAMRYLGLGMGVRIALAAAAIVTMAVLLRRVGQRLGESGVERGARAMTLVIGTLAVLPYRMPGAIDQVVIVPVAVALIGAGWVICDGAGGARDFAMSNRAAVPLALAAIAILALFQLFLRPGIAF